ncbi:MAG TPA: AsmA-like C-terminal region-containing protein, partial [candidate division Zixibacteria bacterium]|nr:AsmA-like C-terminal region-containing protein [candidate division Zixibacteria bacterium]
ALTECVVSAAGTDVTLTAPRIDFAFSQDSLAVSADRLAAKEASLKFEAGLNDFAAPRLRLKAQGGAPLALLAGYLPQGGEPQLGGVANVDLAVSGALAQPERLNISGSLKVRDGSLRATTLPEQLERFTCDIGVAPKKITINALSLQFERSDIALTGEISDPFPYLLPVADSTKEKFPGPYLQFTATSHHFDVDRLFPEAAPGTGVNRASMPLDSVPPILLPEVNGAGVATFDTLIYSEVQFTKVTSDVRIERTRIFCDNIRGTAYSGAVTGNTVIDLTEFDNPTYYGGFNAEQVSAAEVIQRFLGVNVGDYLAGKIKLSGDYSSSGWEPAEFLQALTMNVDAFGAGMELRNAPLTNQWIESLVQTTGKTQLRDKYRTISLKSFQGAFKMEKGRIVVNDLAGEAASLGSWKLSGGMGLDGALDLGGSFVPSQQLISELAGDNALAGALAEYLKDPASGQISAPLTVRGTVEKPVAHLDMSVVQSKIGEAMKKQAGDALKGLFKKR